MLCRPPGRGLQTRTAMQISHVTTSCRPHGACVGEVPVDPQTIAILLDPLAQPWPVADERLVSDLDGRLARHRVDVEGQQPRRTVGVDDRCRDPGELAAYD